MRVLTCHDQQCGPPGATGPATSTPWRPPSPAPPATDEVAAAVRAAAARGRTVKPVGTGHSFTAAAATTGTRLELAGCPGLVRVDPATKTGPGPRRHPAVRAQRRTGRARPGHAQPGRHRRADDLRRARHRHPRHRPGVRLPVHVRRPSWSWSPGPARWCAARATRTRTLPGRAGRRRRRRRGHRGDPALRGRVRPARRRAPDAAAPTCWPAWTSTSRPTTTSSSTGCPTPRRRSRRRNNRVPADDQAARPVHRLVQRRPAREHRAGRACAGCAGRCRRWTPALLRAMRRRLLAARLHRALRPGLHLAAAGPVRGDGVRPAPRGAARGVRRAAADHRPTCRSRSRCRSRCGSPPPTTSGSPRPRAGQRLHRHPPVRRHAVRAVLPGLRGGLHAAGRPAALGQDALPRRPTSLRPAYPHFDDFLAVRDKLDPRRVFANDYTRQVFGD